MFAFIHSLIANCKWVPMDNLQSFSAQDVIYPGPADFCVGSLSITLHSSLLVAGLKLNSFPLKLKEGNLRAIISPLKSPRRAKRLFKQLAMLFSSDITLWPSFSFGIFSVCLFELNLFLINFHCSFEVGRFSKNCFV